MKLVYRLSILATDDNQSSYVRLDCLAGAHPVVKLHAEMRYYVHLFDVRNATLPGMCI